MILTLARFDLAGLIFLWQIKLTTPLLFAFELSRLPLTRKSSVIMFKHKILILFLCFQVKFIVFKSIYKSFYDWFTVLLGNEKEIYFWKFFTRVTSLSALFNPWKWCNRQGKLLQFFFIFFTFPFYINFLMLNINFIIHTNTWAKNANKNFKGRVRQSFWKFWTKFSNFWSTYFYCYLFYFDWYQID